MFLYFICVAYAALDVRNLGRVIFSRRSECTLNFGGADSVARRGCNFGQHSLWGVWNIDVFFGRVLAKLYWGVLAGGSKSTNILFETNNFGIQPECRKS